MPVPLAPLIRITLRAAALVAAGYAARRLILTRAHQGRTDQQAEDAFDNLGDGISLHRPKDRSEPATTQTNSAARLRRVIRIGKRQFRIDAAFMSRLRIERG